LQRFGHVRANIFHLGMIIELGGGKQLV